MVLPREEFLGAITILDEDHDGYVYCSGADVIDLNYLIQNELPSPPWTGTNDGYGSFWVEEGTPSVPKFTDSAGNTFTLGGGGGLDQVLLIGNETGSNWIEINDGFGLRGQAVGSSFSISTLDAISGTTGSIEIKTGTQGNPINSSGDIDILTRSTAGYSGDITIKTEASGKSSGNIEITTDTSSFGSEGSGSIGISTGGGGDITIENGSGATAGDIYLTAGRSTSQDGGDIKLTGGRGDLTNGGNVILYGGRPNISGDRGEVLFGTTDDSGSEYTIARVVDRGPGPPNQIGRAFRFDYFYSLNASIAVDDADGISGNAATTLNIWGSNSYNETTDPGEKGGDIILTAGAGGDSVSSGGGNGGDIILRAGSNGIGGGGNGYVGHVEIDSILQMDSIGSTPLWTPGVNKFIMFNLGGIPKVRPASSITNYNVALVLQANLSSYNFSGIVANASATTTLVVGGAEIGDHVLVTAPSLENGLIVRGHVSAFETVTITVTNDTSGLIDPAPQDFFVTVIKA